MLKNVAIPLMLAASEAEAQRAPDRDELEDALEGDLRKVFNGLQADAAACTVASSQAADNIANLAQAVSDAKATAEQKQKDLAALIADDGAWGLADAARKAAVDAAVAQEAASNIVALLDAMDSKAEDERLKAAAYLAADKLYQAGKIRQTAAIARDGVATARLGELQAASDAAAQQLVATAAQAAKEKLWRGWRYCELGAEVTGATLLTAGRWWSMLDDSALAAAATLPATCVVPAVRNAANDADLRPAITYQTAKSSPADLPGVQTTTAKWTATLVHTEATTALNAESTYQGYSRTAAGQVAWQTESVRSWTWLKAQRDREAVFYGSINSSRAAVFGIASQMADTDTYDVAASPPAETGLVAAAAGAAKALKTAKDARDQTASGATAGSGHVVPSSRVQNANGWDTDWTLNAASMTAWAGANSPTAGASSLWFAKASALSAAMDVWHSKWTADSTQITGTHAESGVNSDAGGAGPCKTATIPTGGTWTGTTGKANVAACKTACEDATKGMLQDLDSAAGVAVGGNTLPKWLTAQTTVWCGAYSFNNGATDADVANAKCILLTGATGATGGTSDVADSICADMTNANAWYTSVNAVKTAYDAVTSTLYNNLVAAADGQAALEKAWLEAWYLQQYWAALKTTLHGTTGGTMATQYQALVTKLGESDASDLKTVAGADASLTSAKSLLESKQTDLAALESTNNDAAAAVAALGTRILRADAQLSSLDGLANAGSTGTLDQAAAKRLADLNAYKNDGVSGDAGESHLATQELAAANLAVKDRTGAGVTDGGALTEARELAQAAWTLAQQAAGTAETDLSDALGVATLVGLRQTVESDTGLWDIQQALVVAAALGAEGAEEDLKNAEKAKDAAVLACQIKAYDAYRTALEAEMVQRAADLKTIKALLETELTKPAPGTAGARCEKALSNGTYRPARGEQTCAEGLCCGAARVWMNIGDGVSDSAWRTVETCQTIETTKYSYQPARAPMATTMPAKVSVDFACIEGAKKLAAAASAVAAAVYMLA